MLRVFIMMLVAGLAAGAEVEWRFTRPESTVVAAVRVPEALQSAAGADLREWVVEAFQACPLVEPVLDDMRRIRFSAYRAGEEGQKRTEWLIHLDGVWNWGAVQDCLLPAGYWGETYRGFPVMLPPVNRVKATAAAWVDGEHVLLAEPGALFRALDHVADGSEVKPELFAQAEELDGDWEHWVAGVGSPLEFNQRTKAEILEALPVSRRYWMGISGTETFRVEVRLEMMTLEEAALVGELFRLLPEMARLRAAERAVQEELLEHLQAETTGTMIRLRGQVVGAFLWRQFSALTRPPASRARFGRMRMVK
jgi:hypothetical protein